MKIPFKSILAMILCCFSSIVSADGATAMANKSAEYTTFAYKDSSKGFLHKRVAQITLAYFQHWELSRRGIKKSIQRLAHDRVKVLEQIAEKKGKPIDSAKMEYVASHLWLRERSQQNILLWRSRGMEDAKKVGVTLEDLHLMQLKVKPLGFESVALWEEFKKELKETLSAAGLGQPTLMIDGTSTTFYSMNPTKEVGHFFDAKTSILDPQATEEQILEARGDYDIKIFSSLLVDQMAEKGLVWDESPYISKHDWIMATYPELKAFHERWTQRLGRWVSMIGVDPQVVSPTDNGGEGFTL